MPFVFECRLVPHFFLLLARAFLLVFLHKWKGELTSGLVHSFRKWSGKTWRAIGQSHRQTTMWMTVCISVSILPPVFVRDPRSSLYIKMNKTFHKCVQSDVLWVKCYFCGEGQTGWNVLYKKTLHLMQGGKTIEYEILRLQPSSWFELVHY